MALSRQHWSVTAIALYGACFTLQLTMGDNSLQNGCPEKWNWLIYPSCSHCLYSESGSDLPLSSSQQCSYAWLRGGKGMCVSPYGTECTTPDESHELVKAQGHSLNEKCQRLIQACLDDTSCSAVYQGFVSQASGGGFRNPSAYCSIMGNCPEDFLKIVQCATSAEEKATCTTDADCSGDTHYCDPNLGTCQANPCCNDISNSDCWGCLFGNTTTSYFCLTYCSTTGNGAIPWQLCQTCQGLQNEPATHCVDNFGVSHNPGELWTNDCESCYCMLNGQISCVSVAVCDIPQCPIDYWRIPHGQCCAQCAGCKDDAGNWYGYGDNYTQGANTCTCENSGYITCVPNWKPSTSPCHTSPSYSPSSSPCHTSPSHSPSSSPCHTSASPSASKSPCMSKSSSASYSSTASSSYSSSPSASYSSSMSASYSASESASYSSSPSASYSASSCMSSSSSASYSPTSSVSYSESPSSTYSASISVSHPPSPCHPSHSHSHSHSRSESASYSASPSKSSCKSHSKSSSASYSSTPSASYSASSCMSMSSTSSPSASYSTSASASYSTSPSASYSTSPCMPSYSSSPSASYSSSASASYSESPSASYSASPCMPSNSKSPSASYSASSSASYSKSPSASYSTSPCMPSSSVSYSKSPSASNSASPCMPSKSKSSSYSQTPSASYSASPCMPSSSASNSKSASASISTSPCMPSTTSSYSSSPSASYSPSPCMPSSTHSRSPIKTPYVSPINVDTASPSRSGAPRPSCSTSPVYVPSCTECPSASPTPCMTSPSPTMTPCSVYPSASPCPPLNCSIELQFIPQNESCPQCGCRNQTGGIVLPGSHWDSMCGQCYCSDNGEVVCTHADCPAPTCPEEYQKLPIGECCPRCVGCKDEWGHWHKYGDKFYAHGKECKCLPSGYVICYPTPSPKPYSTTPTPSMSPCYSMAGASSVSYSATPSATPCPSLNCSADMQFIPHDETCPQCGCHDDQGLHAVGDIWKNGCDVCSCNSSYTIQCRSVKCQAPPCPAAHQYVNQGECCPRCHGCGDENGDWHNMGDHWESDCRTCECTSSGQVSCVDIECPVLHCSPESQEWPEGQCCPICTGCVNDNSTIDSCQFLASLGLCHQVVPGYYDNSGNTLIVQDFCRESCGCCESAEGDCICDDNARVATILGSYGINNCRQLLALPTIHCDHWVLSPLLHDLCPCECP